MTAPVRLARGLARRLPPRAAWALWRAAALVTTPHRRRVPPPEVAVACVAWGASEEGLARLLDELTERGRASVLVITDSDAVGVAAARGCRLEHVPRREDWLRHLPAGDYDAFLAARLASILASYRIGRLERSPGLPAAVERALSRAEGGSSPKG